MFLDEAIACWQRCSTALPPLGRQYSRQEQQDREIRFDLCLEAIKSELLHAPATTSQREEALARITSAFTGFASSALDLDEASVELLRDGFSDVGAHLARQARRFDPSACLDDILQACRNAWTACGLQGLLGHPMRLTPAIFAYSMLYPYTDNYLDDRGISPEAKLAFSMRFRRRLAGSNLSADNSREVAIWRLIELIEAQYDRSAYPQVYDCLLAIHAAQEDSLRQLHGNPPDGGGEMDLLRLSFTKGGASVLADAALAAGSLTQPEARFAFHWGVLLQLGDDLQDLAEDCHRGSLTLFSQAAAAGEPLDLLTNRTLHFAGIVAARLDTLPHGSAALKELLKRSSVSLLIRSAAHAIEFYSTSYIAELESYSPFRFAFMKNRYTEIERRKHGYEKLFEALLAGEDEKWGLT